MRKFSIRLAMITTLTACVARPLPESPAPTSDARIPSPWSEPALAAHDIPAIYETVWRNAPNRMTCALLAPARLEPALERSAIPRAATFSGGWAVAYDLPDSRSAFGVAGTGSNAWEADIYDQWPRKRVFADSSRVGYGLEGGTGPNWLAYVRIPGQQCLYNIWSRRSEAHLEELLGQLRFVRIP